MGYIGDTVEGIGPYRAIGDAVVGWGLEVDEDWWLLVLFIGDAVNGWGLEVDDVWSLLKVLDHVDAVDGWGLEVDEYWWLLVVDGLGSLLKGLDHEDEEQLVVQLMDWWRRYNGWYLNMVFV